MEATKILSEEHRVIENVLTSLETAVERMEKGEAIPPSFFIQATDFFKGFTDGCHHKKEEGVLFPAMVHNGIPPHGGPIDVMLAEHKQGRELTRIMRTSAEKLAAGDETGRPELIEAAHGYISLLRQHITKEDKILFRLADQVIPTEEQPHLLEEYEHVEHEETGEGVHEKYEALAHELAHEAAA